MEDERVETTEPEDTTEDGQEEVEEAGTGGQEDAGKDEGKEKSLEDFLKEEREKAEASGEEEETPEDKAKEPEKEEKPRKGPRKLSAQERVRQAVNEKNKAIQEVEALKAEIENLKQMIQSRQDEPEEEPIIEDETTDYDELRERYLELDYPEELVDEIIEARKEKDNIREELKAIQERLRQQEQERLEKQKEAYKQSMMQTYKKISDEFSEFFEDTADEDGLPNLKPEYEEIAMKIVQRFDVPTENGTYNPLLGTEEGLRLIMNYLKSTVTHAEQEKRKASKVKNAKKMVELPGGRKPPEPRNKTLEEYLAEAQKEVAI